MFKRLFRILIKSYLVLILAPYLILVFFYAILKRFAKEGSEYAESLAGLEDDLITIILDTIKNADYDYLFMNLVVFIWLMIFVGIFSKYKIAIPRKEKAKKQTNVTKAGDKHEEIL